MAEVRKKQVEKKREAAEKEKALIQCIAELEGQLRNKEASAHLFSVPPTVPASTRRAIAATAHGMQTRQIPKPVLSPVGVAEEPVQAEVSKGDDAQELKAPNHSHAVSKPTREDINKRHEELTQVESQEASDTIQRADEKICKWKSVAVER